jgi:transposase
VKVPWAEPGSRFTALFEALAIDWLKTASIQAVAQQMGLTWDQAAGIMKRAVERGLARREAQPLRHLGVDETSFRKRHRYVTVVNDLERDAVLYVGEGRKQETLDEFWTSLPLERREQVAAVAMDMWEPYIRSTREHLPAAESKIVFDKFHVAQHLGQAVDDVRKAEHRKLMAQGEHWLKGTRYDWLRHPDTFTAGAWRAFLKRVRT